MILSYGAEVEEVHLLGNVEDDKDADAAPEVALGDGAILLLTGRVPYLQLDDAIVNSNELLTEFNANGMLRFMVNYRRQIIKLVMPANADSLTCVAQIVIE